MQAGQQVFTLGMNRKCQTIICKSKIVELIPCDEYGRECVIATKGGLEMPSKLSDVYATYDEAAAALAAE